MGIPKFFRYISERWPPINQLINGSQIGEYDNLYLDMNSILHTCTHKDVDATFSMTEEAMFAAIFAYIEHLFTLVRPQKIFYMAIDGVAPRAKMNQQRARRFRTALDAENARKKAIADGVELPKGEPFDSNGITPGTEFMAKLTQQLKYFISKKVSEDADWQNIQVILSGHEVPGEGEHKIMECIRVLKAQPKYNANTRHCVYGLDADLIMLGLLSHDPHFSILREEVVFGPRKSTSATLEQQKFFLLHISLVREYLEIEFKDLEDSISFPFDMERILDDFILLNFFVGNDFLPNLPDLLINDDSIPLFIEIYKKAMKLCNGYMNENGKINLERLAVWLDELEKYEVANFEKTAIDLEWINKDLDSLSLKAKSRKNKIFLSPRQKELVTFIKPFAIEQNSITKELLSNPDNLPSLRLENLTEEDIDTITEFCFNINLRVVSTEDGHHALVFDIDGINSEESEAETIDRNNDVIKMIKIYQRAEIKREEVMAERTVIYNEKFKSWKNEYYHSKLGFTVDDEEDLRALCENYIEGLQWTLYYYYHGVASWSWYYEYHYAPRVSDVKKGLRACLDFKKGQPFKPFEQLMGVLPERSKKLLPHCYWSLMSDENSPIIDFYPHEFDLDMNGKKQEWEAVVKIPFVDETRLLTAMKTKESALSPEERKRNSFGSDLLFGFNPQVDSFYPSSLPGKFLDLEHNHCIISEFKLPTVEASDLVIGLLEGAKSGLESLAGFPTLKVLPFEPKIMPARVRVFNQESRRDTVMLNLQNPYEDLTAEDVAKDLVGTNVHVNYPYLLEAKVFAISDSEGKVTISELHGARHAHRASTPSREFERISQNLRRQYTEKLGIEPGPIRVLVHARRLKGLMRTSEGAYVKEFAGEEEDELVFPVQTVVESVRFVDERFAERPALPVTEEFPVGERVVFLGDFCYGSPAIVSGHGKDVINVQVARVISGEPTIGTKIANWETNNTRYHPSYNVANILGMHPLLLSKITTRCMVEINSNKKVDVGLNLRSEAKREKVLGYTRKGLRGWEYSDKAISLIKSYKQTFPAFLMGLQSAGNGIPKASHIFKADDPAQAILPIQQWVKAQKVDPKLVLSFESEVLSDEAVHKIEDFIRDYSKTPLKTVPTIVKSIPRTALLIPSEAFHQLRPQKFSLGDRVIYVQDSGKVPLFTRGTVIGINSQGVKVNLEIAFDQVFMSGTNLNGKLQDNRGIIIEATCVMNLTHRQLVYHTKASKTNAPSKGPKAIKSVTPKDAAWVKKSKDNQSGSKPEASAKPEASSKPKKAIQIKKPQQSADKELMSLLNATPKAVQHEETAEEKAVKSDLALKNIKPSAEIKAIGPQHLFGAVYNKYIPGPPMPPHHQHMPPHMVVHHQHTGPPHPQMHPHMHPHHMGGHHIGQMPYMNMPPPPPPTHMGMNPNGEPYGMAPALAPQPQHPHGPHLGGGYTSMDGENGNEAQATADLMAALNIGNKAASVESGENAGVESANVDGEGQGEGGNQGGSHRGGSRGGHRGSRGGPRGGSRGGHRGGSRGGHHRGESQPIQNAKQSE